MPRTIYKRVHLNYEDVEWFEENYSDRSFSWVLDMLLRKFREAHTLTPNDIATLAAREVKEDA